jgi:hypothetical protein
MRIMRHHVGRSGTGLVQQTPMRVVTTGNLHRTSEGQRPNPSLNGNAEVLLNSFEDPIIGVDAMLNARLLTGSDEVISDRNFTGTKSLGLITLADPEGTCAHHVEVETRILKTLLRHLSIELKVSQGFVQAGILIKFLVSSAERRR